MPPQPEINCVIILTGAQVTTVLDRDTVYEKVEDALDKGVRFVEVPGFIQRAPDKEPEAVTVRVAVAGIQAIL